MAQDTEIRAHPGILDATLNNQIPIPTAQSWTAPARFDSLSTYFNGITPTPAGLLWGLDWVKILDDVPGTPLRPFDGQLFRVLYPQNSINPRGAIQGGLGFATTFGLNLTRARRVVLEYSVLFPLGFDFALGGKLPGLYGMTPGTEAPTGGDSAEDGWSARLMWRKGGKGEVYLYVPDDQVPELLAVPPRSSRNAKYGRSIGVGSFSFVPGHWTSVHLDVALNDPGQHNGVLNLTVNTKPAVFFDRLSFRSNNRYAFDGAMFETFFGGHTKRWRSPKRQYAYFGGFRLSIMD